MPNSLVRNPVTNWTAGSSVLANELSTLDANLQYAVNGDDGGCYAPTGAIIIGGQGLQLSGPLSVARGGNVTTGSGSSLTVTVTGGVPAWPKLSSLHAGRTIKRMVPCAVGRGFPGYMWRARRTDGGVQSIAPTYTDWTSNKPKRAKWLVPVCAVHGSTLGSVTLHFRVGYVHTALPTAMPSARVLRVDSLGNFVALSSTASGADLDGFVSAAAPSSPSLWAPSSGLKTIVVTCDQNNAVDRTIYSYVVEIVDELSTDFPMALTVKKPVRLTHSAADNVYPKGLQTLDGVATADGDRVLLTSCPDPSQNGLWIVHSGGWSRASDWAASTDFTQGMIIPAQAGATNGGTLRQVSSLQTSWTAGTTPSGTVGWANNTAYSSGATVVPTSARQNGYWYQCTTAGTSAALAASEPTWPTSPGQTVTDGTVVWTCSGQTATPTMLVVRADGDSAVEGSAIVPHGNIFQSLLVEFDKVSDTRFR